MSWSGGGAACSLMRINCVVLLLVSQYTIQKAMADPPEPPPQWTWQMEEIHENSDAAHIQSLREGDVIVSYQDVPLFLFPCTVRGVDVLCTQPPGYSSASLSVLPAVYDGNGDVRYISDIEYTIVPGSYNYIPFDEMHNTYLSQKTGVDMESPVVFDFWDWFGMDADGLYIGLMVTGIVEGEMNDWTPGLASATSGIWSGANLLGSGGEWSYLDQDGLPGNLAIRAVIEPMCPKLIGDIDHDGCVSDYDAQLVNQAITEGGDTFNSWHRYVDLNNDWTIDSADTAIVTSNHTGTNVPVVVPLLDLLTPQINRVFPYGSHPPVDVIELRNKGTTYPWYDDPPPGSHPDPMSFTAVADAPWLTLDAADGSSSGEIQQIILHYATDSLSPGSYNTLVRIDVAAPNTPAFVPVHVTIRTAGDFDMDGEVDAADRDMFLACLTGPSVLYTSGGLPAECQIGSDGNFCLADFDQDGDIDQDDFGAFQRQFAIEPDAPLAGPQPGPDPCWLSFPEQYKHIPSVKEILQDPGGPHRAHVVIYIVVGAIALFFLLYFALPFYRTATAMPFINTSQTPNPVEGARIRKAINYLTFLSTRPGASPDIAQAVSMLGRPQWYNADDPNGCGCVPLLLINRRPVGDRDSKGKLVDEVGEEHTVAEVAWMPSSGGIFTGKIALRQDRIDKAIWDNGLPDDQAGDDTVKLAWLLFADWEHCKYGANENTCQGWLQAAMQTTEEWNQMYPFQLGFRHGENERACQW